MNPGGPAGCVFLVLLAAASAEGMFEQERPGARAAGLAGAFVAVANDGDAMLYNPAGLAQLPVGFLTATLGRPLAGLDDGELVESRLAYVQPAGKSDVIGLSWFNRRLSALYQENIVQAAYATALDADDTFLAGGALKILHVDYVDGQALAENPFFADGSTVMGLSADAGVLAFLDETWAVGAAVINAYPVPMTVSHTDMRAPVHVRAGVSAALGDGLASLDGLWTPGGMRAAAGAEWWWFNHGLAARTGVAFGDAGLAEGTTGFTLHAESESWGLRLDYAVVVLLGKASGLSPGHAMTLSVLFGALNPEIARARQLLAAGREALNRGDREAALKAWEEASEFLPEAEAEALEADIAGMRDSLDRETEIALAYRTAETFEAEANLQNAAYAYRRILALDGDEEKARVRLAHVEDRLQALTRDQAASTWKVEKQSAEKAKQELAARAEAHVGRAEKAMAKIALRKDLMAQFPKEYQRLERQFRSARAALVNRAWERAEAVAKGVEERARLLEAKTVQPAKKIRKRPVVEPTPGPPAVQPAKPSTAPSAVVGAEDSGTARKMARGAYGRTIKLMLDIDRLQGSRWFPREYAELRQAVGDLKSTLEEGQYADVVTRAKEIFPRLEALKNQCQEKKRTREMMPTHW